MRFRSIKKIIALGIGLSLACSALISASAFQLSDFPTPFIAEGIPVSNFAIVIGDMADASDVIGAMDVMQSLQLSSVVYSEPEDDIEIEGDYAEISTDADMLEIDEPIGNVREVLTENDLMMLKGESPKEGVFDYNQYLRFNSSASADGYVTLKADERKTGGHYLFWNSGSMIFEWEGEFEDVLDSDVDGAVLEDFEDSEFFILGKSFEVADAALTNNNRTLYLNLMSGVVSGLLGENDREIYVIEGKEYDVEVLVISETSENGEGSVKFRINGEITDELKDGDTDLLADGTLVGVRDILATGKDIQKSIVQFYIATETIDFTDTNVSDDSFEQGVRVNKEQLEDSLIKLKGDMDSEGDFNLHSITYRLLAESVLGDVNILPGKGLREQLDEPEGMLTPDWDIRYAGLATDDTTFVRLDGQGGNEYNLEFTNQEGVFYDVPFATNAGGVLKYGDDDNDLWFVETESYVVDKGDFFVLGECSVVLDDDTCNTHVLRYDAIDTSNRVLTFTDLGIGTREVAYDAATNQANFVSAGRTYLMEVSGTNLRIDLNGDSAFVNDTEVFVNIRGDGLFDLGSIHPGSLNGTISGSRPVLNSINASLVISTLEFEEADVNEVTNITIEPRAENKITIPSTGIFASSGAFHGMVDLGRDDDIDLGLSMYGAYFEMSNSETEAPDLSIEYPVSQREPRVFIAGGLAKINTGVKGDSEQIVPIRIGSAHLASEIADITQFNAVVVGGPCANSISAQLLGRTEPCWSSVPENKAIIKLVEHENSNVAMIVAGRSALNTRQACRTLANGDIAEIDGSSAEVEGSDFGNITVSKI